MTVSADRASRVFQVDSGERPTSAALASRVVRPRAAAAACSSTGAWPHDRLQDHRQLRRGWQPSRRYGAGRASQGGNVTLTDCTVSGNSAEESNGGGGGGVATLTNGTTTLIDSTISDNFALSI